MLFKSHLILQNFSNHKMYNFNLTMLSISGVDIKIADIQRCGKQISSGRTLKQFMKEQVKCVLSANLMIFRNQDTKKICLKALFELICNFKNSQSVVSICPPNVANVAELAPPVSLCWRHIAQAG